MIGVLGEDWGSPELVAYNKPTPFLFLLSVCQTTQKGMPSKCSAQAKLNRKPYLSIKGYLGTMEGRIFAQCLSEQSIKTSRNGRKRGYLKCVCRLRTLLVHPSTLAAVACLPVSPSRTRRETVKGIGYSLGRVQVEWMLWLEENTRKQNQCFFPFPVSLMHPPYLLHLD